MREFNATVGVFVLALCVSATQAQDSTANSLGCNDPDLLQPAISDAVVPWDVNEQCNNYVVDLDEFFGSWGSSFGIAPIAKSSQAAPQFPTSFVNSQAISRQHLQGVSYFQDSYAYWNEFGRGVNDNPAKNDAPNMQIDTSAFSGNQFAFAFNEGANTNGGVNHDGVISGIVNYDPKNPNRLYVSRVNAAVVGCDEFGQFAGLALGAVDANGNVMARSDDFSAGFDDVCGGTFLTVIDDDNIFRFDTASRDCGRLNVVSGDFLGGGQFDLGATEWVARMSAVTLVTPNIMPEEVRGGASLYLGTNFNGEYVYEDVSIGAMPGDLVTTTDHLDEAIEINPVLNGSDQRSRGNLAYISKNCACLNSTHGIAATYGKDDDVLNDETDLANTVIQLWGLGPDGEITGKLAIKLPDVVTDPTTGQTNLGGTNEFTFASSQTPFNGGNGQIGMNVLPDGSLMIAAPVSHPDVPGNPGNDLWGPAYIATARIDCGSCGQATCDDTEDTCDPNISTDCNSGADGICVTPAEWAMAAWTLPWDIMGTCETGGAPCSPFDAMACNNGADGECELAGQITGKPILNGSSFEGGTAFARQSIVTFQSAGTAAAVTMTPPAVDAGGNIWFVGSFRFLNSAGTEFGLFRAVYNPDDVAPYGHELELVLRTDDFNFPFNGRNSDRDYQITFFGLDFDDNNSISSSAFYSGNISEQAYLGGMADGLDPSDPENLGGLVLAAEIIYDADDDGDFFECDDINSGRCELMGVLGDVCLLDDMGMPQPGNCDDGKEGVCVPDPNNFDQEYRVLLYISPFAPEGPPPVPCTRDCDCYFAAVDAAGMAGTDPNTELDICDYHYCLDDVCTSCSRRYGNTCDSFDGFVQTDDILCAVAGFGNYCACPNGDLIDGGATGCSPGTPENCKGPSGSPLGTDDILAVVAAFGGANPFSCAVPAGGTGCAADSPPSVGGCGPAASSEAIAAVNSNATRRLGDSFGGQLESGFTLVPRQRAIKAGGTVDVDVYASGVANLRGYEFGVTAGSGRRGALTLDAVSVDTDRADYAFAGLHNFPAIDSELGRVGAAVMGMGESIPANKRAYVGTFTFRASDDAAGAFNISAAMEHVGLFTDGFTSQTVSAVDDVMVLVTNSSPTRRSAYSSTQARAGQ